MMEQMEQRLGASPPPDPLVQMILKELDDLEGRTRQARDVLMEVENTQRLAFERIKRLTLALDALEPGVAAARESQAKLPPLPGTGASFGGIR